MLQLFALEAIVVVWASTTITINVLVGRSVLNGDFAFGADPIVCHTFVAIWARAGYLDGTPP